MNTKKILDSEINGLRIASLPSRPTAPTSFGGRGFTATEMKEAFDKLSLFIIKRFNMLLDDVASEGEGSLSSEIPSGIKEGHTLADFFADVTSGELPIYLSLGEETLLEMKERLNDERTSADEKIAYCLLHVADAVIDASFPSKRNAETGEVEI